MICGILVTVLGETFACCARYGHGGAHRLDPAKVREKFSQRRSPCQPHEFRDGECQRCGRFEDAIAAPFKLGDCIRAKGETLTASVSEVLRAERMCRVCWHDDKAFGLVRWDEIELVPLEGRPDPARNEASGETTKNT